MRFSASFSQFLGQVFGIGNFKVFKTAMVIIIILFNRFKTFLILLRNTEGDFKGYVLFGFHRNRSKNNKVEIIFYLHGHGVKLRPWNWIFKNI